MADNDARLQVVLEAKIDKLTERLSAANRAVYGASGKIQRDIDRMNRKFETLGSGLGGATDRIRGYLAAIGVALSIREVQQYADAWTNARNKLAAAGVAVGDLASRQNELADLANRTRTSFDATVDLYSKLTRATQTLGLSQQEVAQLTETLNMAFKAGGASTQEQTAAILQLSQALSSGALQGDELRSIRENAPLLAKAIADEFGVTIGALKDLGAEGLLTSDRIVKAVQRARGEIEATFKSTVPTIGDAFTKLETEFGRYINSANAATGASAQLAGFISTVADNFDLLADAAVVAASAIGGALAGQAMVKAAVGLRALAAGATGAAGAMGILRGAMAFLGGPWGVAITAIGAALGFLAIETGKARVATQQLEQRIKAQADAFGDADKAAASHRQSVGNLTAAELDAAKKTAALTGEVRLLEDAHYRAAAAAKAHALAEAGARLEQAKTDAAEQRRVVDRSRRRVAAQGAAGFGEAGVPASFRSEFNAGITAATSREAAVLATALANVRRAEAELAALRARTLRDPGFQPASRRPAAAAGGGGGGGGGRSRRSSRSAIEPDDTIDAEEAALREALSYWREVEARGNEAVETFRDSGLIPTTEAMADLADVMARINGEAYGFAEILSNEMSRGFEDVADAIAASIVYGRDLGDMLISIFRNVSAQIISQSIQSVIGGSGGALSFLRTGLSLFGGAIGGGASGSVKNINQKFASGGYTGDGPTSSIAGVVHGQEFVVNAAATRQHLGLLRAINSGVAPRAATASNRSFVQHLNVSVSPIGGMTAADARRSGQQIASAAMQSMALARRKGFA
jgi:tape measure domain-containing protein